MNVRDYAKPLAVILIVAATLRFVCIGANGYWIDELVSVHFASHQNWKAIFWDNNPFLYHLILRIWIHLFGNTEIATRSLSALVSTGTTAVMFFTGYRLAGRRGACVFGLLQAFSLLSLTYAQESRMYALLEFFTALTLYQCLVALLEKHIPRSFFFAAIGLCLSSYLAVVPLGLECAALAVANRGNRKRVLTAALVLAAGTAAAGLSYSLNFQWSQLSWQKYKFAAEAQSHDPSVVLWDLANKSYATVAGIALTLALFGAVFKNRRAKTGALGLFFVVVAIGGFWTLSVFEERAVFLPRYFIYLIPFCVLWAGTTISLAMENSGLRRLLGIAALTLIVGGGVFSLPWVYGIHKSPWREAADFVSQYSDSHGLTTRTAAIKTPYFDKYGIDVEKWVPSQQKFDYVLDEAWKYHNLWFIENYYGGLQYLDKMKTRFDEAGFRTRINVISKGRGEPVLLLHVFRDP